MRNLCTKNKLKRCFNEWVPAILAVCLLYAFFSIAGIGCPIKFITGVSCAGCGMTRAWIALLHLNFKAAFYYHPLFFMPPAVILLFFYKEKLSDKVYKILIFTTVLMFAIIYLYRMFSSNSIVVFQPENGIVFRILRKFY
jgi:hypothetical protein